MIFKIIVGDVYYLPATTSQALTYQITDVESDPAVEDNTNTFLDSAFWNSPNISLTPPTSPEQVIETFVQTQNTWYISSTGPTTPPPITTGCGASSTMNPHGGSTSFQQSCTTPEPSSAMGIIALGIIGGGATLKRKLKSGNSTDK